MSKYANKIESFQDDNKQQIEIGDLVRVYGGANYHGQWEYDELLFIEDNKNTLDALGAAEHIEIEKKNALLWKDVLDPDKITVMKNLFDSSDIVINRKNFMDFVQKTTNTIFLGPNEENIIPEKADFIDYMFSQMSKRKQIARELLNKMPYIRMQIDKIGGTAKSYAQEIYLSITLPSIYESIFYKAQESIKANCSYSKINITKNNNTLNINLFIEPESQYKSPFFYINIIKGILYAYINNEIYLLQNQNFLNIKELYYKYNTIFKFRFEPDYKQVQQIIRKLPEPFNKIKIIQGKTNKQIIIKHNPDIIDAKGLCSDFGFDFSSVFLKIKSKNNTISDVSLSNILENIISKHIEYAGHPLDRNIYYYTLYKEHDILDKHLLDLYRAYKINKPVSRYDLFQQININKYHYQFMIKNIDLMCCNLLQQDLNIIKKVVEQYINNILTTYALILSIEITLSKTKNKFLFNDKKDRDKIIYNILKAGEDFLLFQDFVKTKRYIKINSKRLNI